MKELILEKVIKTYELPEFGYKSLSDNNYYVKLHINDPHSSINGKLHLSKDNLNFSTISDSYFSFVDLYSDKSFYLSLEFESFIDPVIMKTNTFNYNNPANKIKIKLLNGILNYDYLTDTATSNPYKEDVDVDYFMLQNDIKVYHSIYW